MRHARIEDGGVLYRAHHPRWAFLPLSGEGAAQASGRFNRPGVPALHLSLEEATSAAEYRQDNDVADPYTLVAYVSHPPDLVDLRQRVGSALARLGLRLARAVRRGQ